MSSHENQTDSLMSFDGLLVRSDRVVFVVCVVFGLLTVAFAAASTSAAVAITFTLAAILLLVSRFVVQNVSREHVKISCHSDGLHLVRGNGKLVKAPWKFFGSIRLTKRGQSSSAADSFRWRVYLSNEYRPSIGSFLHHSASDLTIFYFPLEIDIEANSDEAKNIEQTISTILTSGTVGDTRSPRVAPVTIDRETLFSLHECVKCNYSLRGHDRKGRCPECGFAFDERMFTIDATTIGRISTTVLLIPIIIALFMMTAVFHFISFLLLFGITFAAIQVWQHVKTTKWFRSNLSRRYLVTSHGLEVWKGGTQISAYTWASITKLETLTVDYGRWRLAVWLVPIHSVRFNSLFGQWITRPPNPPAVDVFINGNREVGRMVCNEIVNRRNAKLPKVDQTPLTE